MCQRVHPHMEVGDVHAHGLLAHSRLVRVTRRLVVVWEGNDGGTDTCTEWKREREEGHEERNYSTSQTLKWDMGPFR